MSGELGRRVLVALVGIPVVLGCIYFGGWALGVLLAVAAALAAWEFFALARSRGIRPFGATGVVASAALVVLATARPTWDAWAPPALGLVFLLLAFTLVAAVWTRWPEGEPLPAVAVTVAGVLYTGGTLSCGIFLRALPDALPEGAGPVPWHASAFLLLPLLTTWVGDTSAYFAGRAWGRRKLFPLASPGKTVAGGVAGLIGSVLVAALLALFSLSVMPGAPVGVGLAALLGAALGAAAQLGDVAESVMKRWAGVKDSGSILPGHGGMLDRVDALLLAIPVAWALLVAVGVVP